MQFEAFPFGHVSHGEYCVTVARTHLPDFAIGRPPARAERGLKEKIVKTIATMIVN